MWSANGTRIMADVFKYVPYEDDIEMQKDLPGLEQDERIDPALVFRGPVLQGTRKDVIREGTLIILREPMGWCAVINDRLYQLSDIQRGALNKPRAEIQAKAASKALFKTYEPNTHSEIMLSLKEDGHLCWLQTMVYLQIAHVVIASRKCGSFIWPRIRLSCCAPPRVGRRCSNPVSLQFASTRTLFYSRVPAPGLGCV